jgi:hypothetical protein
MKPFLTGKKQLEITPLRFPSTPSPLAAAAAKAARCPAPAATPDSAADAPAGVPRVEVIREGDKVVRLVVTCSCGELIEVDCQYPSEG